MTQQEMVVAYFIIFKGTENQELQVKNPSPS
jgi:hypothetical protein